MQQVKANVQAKYGPKPRTNARMEMPVRQVSAAKQHLNTFREKLVSKQKQDIRSKLRSQLKNTIKDGPTKQIVPQVPLSSPVVPQGALKTHLNTIRQSLRSKERADIRAQSRSKLVNTLYTGQKPKQPPISKNRQPTITKNHLEVIRESMRSKEKADVRASARYSLLKKQYKLPQPVISEQQHPKPQLSLNRYQILTLTPIPKKAKKLSLRNSTQVKILPVTKSWNWSKNELHMVSLPQQSAYVQKESEYLPQQNVYAQKEPESAPIGNEHRPVEVNNIPTIDYHAPLSKPIQEITIGEQKIGIATNEFNQYWIGVTIKKQNETLFTINGILCADLDEVRAIPSLFYQSLEQSLQDKRRIVLPFPKSNNALIRDIYKGIEYISLRKFVYYGNNPFLSRNGFNLTLSEFFDFCDKIQLL